MHIDNIISTLVPPVKTLKLKSYLGQQTHWICKSSILLCLRRAEYTMRILQLALLLYKKYMGEFWSLTNYLCGIIPWMFH